MLKGQPQDIDMWSVEFQSGNGINHDESIFIHLPVSIHLFIHLFMYSSSSIYASMQLSIHLCNYPTVYIYMYIIYIYMYIYMYIYIYEQRTNLYVKSNAMHKSGSSLSVMRVLCNLRQAKGKQD